MPIYHLYDTIKFKCSICEYTIKFQKNEKLCVKLLHIHMLKTHNISLPYEPTTHYFNIDEKTHKEEKI